MSFKALPNEILLDIFEHIAINKHLRSEKLTVPSGYQTSLRCLSLCSWRLNRLVTPILYRTFIDGENLYLFLRTVITNPDYAQHVRQFVGRTHTARIMGGYSEQDFTVCQAGITTISSSTNEAREWMTDLQHANWEAMVAVMLFFVPNLEVLRFNRLLDSAWWNESEYIPRVLEYAASVQLGEDAPASPLTKLSFVSLRRQYDDDHISIKHLRPFLTLKSISKVHVRGFWDSSIHVPTQETLQPGTKDLQINHYGTCDKSVLIGFFRCFSSLERFTCTCTVVKGTRRIDVEGRPFAQHLGQAIAHLTNCLEELGLYNVRTTAGGSENPQSIGSLAKFEKLRIIRMDAYVLFGPPLPLYPDQHQRLDHKMIRLVDVLPTSIQEVALGNCDFDQIKHQLQELLARTREFPALRKIWIKIATFTVNEEIRQNLITDYQTAGISLIISFHLVGASLASPEDTGRTIAY
jgi:hypothetical protein